MIPEMRAFGVLALMSQGFDSSPFVDEGDHVFTGPTAFLWEAASEGTLHVWASSDEVDADLRLEGERGSVIEDEDSGGGTTAFAELSVLEGERVLITIAAPATDEEAEIGLSVQFSPASEAAALAVQEARSALDAAHDLSPGDARRRLAEILADLEPFAQDPGVARVFKPLTEQAREAEGLELEARSLKLLLAYFERTRPPDHPDLAIVRNDLGGALVRLGEPRRGLELLEKVLATREQLLPPEHPALEAVRTQVAGTWYALGDLQRAHDLLQDSFEAQSSVLADEDPQLQLARMNLGAMKATLGDLEGAERLLTRTYAIWEKTLPEEDRRRLHSAFNLANVLRSRGDLLAARPLFERVLAVRERVLPLGHPDLLISKQGLAATIAQLGDNRGARELFEQALEAASRALPEDHPALMRARINLAICLRGLGENEGARELLDVVDESSARTLGEEHPDRLVIRYQLAELQRETGEIERSLELHREVLAARARILPERHPDLLLSRAQVARSLASLGRRAEARDLFEEVHIAMRDTLPRDHPWRRNVARHLIRARTAVGDVAAARELGFELVRDLRGVLRAMALAVSPREFEERAEEMEADLATLAQLSAAEGERGPDEALEAEVFALIETLRGAAAAASRVLRRSSERESVAKARERVSETTRTLVQIVSAGADRETWRRALMDRDAAQEAVLRAVADERDLVRDPTVEAIAAELESREVAVSFRRISRSESSGAGEYEAFEARVLDSEGELVRLDLGPAEAIERAALAWRSAVETELPTRGRPVDRPAESSAGGGRELSELLLVPLEPYLAGADRITVALDDVLHLVPLDALTLPGEEGALLGERKRVRVVGSLWDLLDPLPPPDGPPELVAVGGIDYSSSTDEAGVVSAALVHVGPFESGFTPLPATAEEVRRLAEVAKSGVEAEIHVLSGSAATVQALIGRAPTARWLHLATHGYFAPELAGEIGGGIVDEHHGFEIPRAVGTPVQDMSPLALCGLALAGANAPPDALGRIPGVLTAEELSTFDLGACELAVLSACDTSVGVRTAGQGVASLQKALHVAGARSVITSLWKVRDESTMELMIEFYRRLWLEGMPKDRALWEAKMHLREAVDADGRPRYATGDWAGWVLTGVID